jgi:hypothetical protein
MKLKFEIDRTPIEFEREPIAGRCTVKIGAVESVLESPLNPCTHLSIKLTKHWQFSVKGRDVVIQRERQRLFGGIRPQTYRVFVDWELVQQHEGY